MSVYVDELRVWGLWKYGKSCHLTADTVEELREFGVGRLGMQPGWLHNRADFPHFDLTAGRRTKAVSLGAIETTARERLTHMKARSMPLAQEVARAKEMGLGD